MTGARRDRLYVFFALNYAAQGLSGVAYEPIDYLLKDRLGLSAGASGSFIFWMTFPFLIKPLFGLLSDLWPGATRRAQIAWVAAAAAASWLVLAALPDYSYGPLLALLVLVNVGACSADVICDAVMVERGNAAKKTGVYQAVQMATLYLGLVVTGLGAGWLSAHVSFRSVFALSALFPLLILVSSLWAEEGERKPPRALPGLWRLFCERRFWVLSAFIFLWSFYPVLGTAQFYFQSNVLGLSPVFIGFLSTVAGVAGVLGAALYGRTIGGRLSHEQWVRGAVWIGTPLSALYAFYFGPWSVALVTAATGLLGVAFRLSLMDLAARSCPEGLEATAFAAYMAVFNLAAAASNALGGRLYDLLGAGWGGPYPAFLGLTAIGTACTAACWALLPATAPAAQSATMRLAPR